MDKKILVVDDAMFMRSIIRKILKEDGYTQVWEAQDGGITADGEKAMELFREVSPDLVLLDITMPGRSGLEVLEEMLSLVPNIRVIMCSAVGQEMMIQKALTIGAADFIVKPFKADEFSRIVNRCLEQ